MSRIQILVVVVSALVIGASVAVGFGALKDDESDTAAPATAARSTTTNPLSGPRAVNRIPKVKAVGCVNLKLSKAERSSLEARVFHREATKGSVYFGACEGSVWSMARFEGGGDGVFRNVRSDDSRRLGSIVDAKCDVPAKLLKLWRQYNACRPQQIAQEPAPPEPPPADPEPEPEPSPAPQPPPGSDSGMNRRLPNGRTWYQQALHCRIMQQAGVPCYVPPL